MTPARVRQQADPPPPEHKIFEQGPLVGRTNLEPLQDKRVDVEYEMTIGDGTAGRVRRVPRPAAQRSRLTTTVSRIESRTETTIMARHPAVPPRNPISVFPMRMPFRYPVAAEETGAPPVAGRPSAAAPGGPSGGG